MWTWCALGPDLGGYTKFCGAKMIKCDMIHKVEVVFSRVNNAWKSWRKCYFWRRRPPLLSISLPKCCLNFEMVSSALKCRNDRLFFTMRHPIICKTWYVSVGNCLFCKSIVCCFCVFMIVKLTFPPTQPRLCYGRDNATKYY